MRSLAREIRSFLGEQGIDLKGKTVLCAVSGGRDSMALLRSMTELGAAEGFAVAAAHYNHCLRATADRDEAFVRRCCAETGIPLTVGRGDAAAFARREKTSVEDGARILRYDFLERTADDVGADYIATAHHARDNTETVLLHLLRGAGLTGLGGIPPVRGRIIRPLLFVDRAEIEAYLFENNVPYVEDETNMDTAYDRNRLRHEILPLLENFSPGATARIAETAARLRRDGDCLDRQAAALLPSEGKRGETVIPCTLLREQHGAVAVRVVRAAAQRLGITLTAPQAEAVLSLRANACLVLPGGVRAANEGGCVRFFRMDDAPAPLLLRPGEQAWGAYRVTMREGAWDEQESENRLVLAVAAKPLTIAAWNGTGRLTVPNGSRTVKRLLTDRGISVSRQEGRPALFAGGRLAAVFGAGTDEDLRPAEGGKSIVVTLVKED